MLVNICMFRGVLKKMADLLSHAVSSDTHFFQFSAGFSHAIVLPSAKLLSHFFATL